MKKFLWGVLLVYLVTGGIIGAWVISTGTSLTLQQAGAFMFLGAACGFTAWVSILVNTKAVRRG